MMIFDPGKQPFHWENDIGDVVRIIVDDVHLGCGLAAATVLDIPNRHPIEIDGGQRVTHSDSEHACTIVYDELSISTPMIL
jgi:hypothetical protein